jgi:AcrR family transcriptional regulator
MGNQQIRTPQQQRSIEKRSRIIEAGYQLFCDKGYHNTNTAEIAKLAGVSTGIVYSYFKDKKDIFMYVIEEYENSVTAPAYDLIKTLKEPADLAKVIRQMIVKLTESHTLTKSVHEEMQALSHTDKEVGELYCRFQSNIAGNLVSLMDQFNLHPTNAYEKAHLIIDIIENLSHEIVYHQHEYLNYEVMTDVAVNVIVDMLTC